MSLLNSKIAIIGAGKIAHSLSSALNKAGFKIISIISKDIKSAKLLAHKINAGKFSNKISEVDPSANLIILSVPDDQIKKIASSLSRLNLRFDKKIFIHLSGVESLQALKPLAKVGGEIASLHIMQTFPSKKINNISGCWCAVETTNEITQKKLFALAKSIELNPFQIKSENKVLYHLAGVFASNFITGNLFSASELFSNAAEQDLFLKVFRSISETAIANNFKEGILNSLSGPIERGDVSTIITHLKALKSIKDFNSGMKKILMKNYVHQSLTLLELIKRRDGKLSGQHLKIKKLLKVASANL